jgi:tungstate transport system ATP-binding protein
MSAARGLEPAPRPARGTRAPAALLPLEVTGLEYAVGGRVLLENVSFRLEAGRRTVILGPNGAGKSLILRLCQGLLRPTSGRIAWAGPQRRGRRLRHAMVFQRPVLLRRSALANLVHALHLAGLGYRARHLRAREALARFGLETFESRSARILSGGEQQRLAMARAWALEPEVLFLDEPTASLDPASTLAIEGLLIDAQRRGIKIIVVTHDVGQARRLAQDVVFLHRGRVVEHRPAKMFFQRPESEAARAFLAGGLVL